MDGTNHEQGQTHANATPTGRPGLLVRARRAGGAVVRACAGVAAGWRGERRGTFLVMVVGVLALLSVIAIVYSAIGVGDRSRSAAVVKQERLTEAPTQVKDWILNILAIDVLNTYYDARPTGNAVPRLRREATDYPFTEWNVVSSRDRFNRANAPLFNVTGGFDSTLPANFWADRWVPQDPWLASTTPVWLHFRNNNAERNGQTTAAGQSINENIRDWAHISNIAPDGRYVNLFNLRGNFEAKPGVQDREMSDKLSLLNHRIPLDPMAPALTVTRTDFDLDVMGPANADRPALWSNRQVGLFRPVTSLGNVNDARFLNYQYADADGDGMYDSRWQELIDSRDPNNVFRVISADPKYRWFVGCRIIDLSSLVNVNTATDLVKAPTAEAPVGATPADVDLWRLLTGQDDREAFGFTAPDINSSNTTMQVNPAPNTNLARLSYDILPGMTLTSGTPRNDPAVYYSPAGPPPPAQSPWYDLDRALVVGGNAYRSLRVGVGAAQVPPLSIAGPGGSAISLAGNMLVPLTGGPADEETFAGMTGLLSGTGRSRWQFDFAAPISVNSSADDGAFRRQDYYFRRITELDGARRDTVAAGAPERFRSELVFGTEDLAELLTRHGANDPSLRSALETAFAGRTSESIGPISSLRYSPMRDNRPLSMELARDVAENAGSGNGVPDANIYQGLAADKRRLLTTISSARPLMSGDRVDPTRLYEGLDLKTNLPETLMDLAFPSTAGGALAANVQAAATNRIFKAYANGLLPYSDLENAWSPVGGGARLQTLAYGYAGPEKAAYLAAFSALNLQTMMLRDSTATALSTPATSPFGGHTLILSADGLELVRQDRTTFPEAVGYDATGGRSSAASGRILDLDVRSIDPQNVSRNTRNATADSRLAPTGTATVTPSGAATLYPVEPQPFITAVSCFTAYADAPGDYERRGNRITIRPEVKEDNSDFLFRLVAFQIHNPNATKIELSSDDMVAAQPPTPGQPNPEKFNMQFLDIGNPQYPRMDTQKDYYYIQFGNRTFKLIALSEGTIDYPNTPDTGNLASEGKRYFYDEEFVARTTVVPGQRAKPALQATTQSLGEQLARFGGMVPAAGATGALSQRADLPAPGGIGVNAMRIVIPAGKTVVCYALSQPPSTIITRMVRAENPNLQPADKLTDLERRASSTLRQAIYKAIGARTTPPQPAEAIAHGIDAVYWIPEIDAPRLNPSNVLQLANSGDAGSFNDDRNGGAPEWRFQGYKQFGTAPDANDSYGLRAFGQLLQKHATPTPEPNRAALLFRTRRYGTEGIPGTTPVPNVCWDGVTPFGTSSLQLYPPNIYGNDQLVDRFRMPPADASGTTIFDLDSRIRSTQAQVEIDGAIAGDENEPNPSISDDNGYTIMLWAMATRPEDPSATANGDQVPSGVIPAYCIEPRATAAGTSWNRYATWLLSSGGANASAFDGLPDKARLTALNGQGTFGYTLRRWLFDLRTRSSNTDLDLLAKAPNQRNTGNNAIDNKGPDPSLTLATRQLYASVYPVVPTFSYSKGDDFMPALTESASQETLRNLRRIRPTDALLPLAVGTIHSPNGATPNPANDWITFGEMLAVTMGYDSGPVADDPPVYRLFRPSLPNVVYPITTPPRPLASGNLVLDDYPPFEMGNPRVNPVFGGNANDKRYGLQIPAALAVLDQFTTLPQGSLTKGVPGLINANTMPQSVARTVPMLAPTTARGQANDMGLGNGGFKPQGPLFVPAPGLLPDPGPAKNQYWWGVVGTPPPGTTTLPMTIDATASVVGYRDKGEAYIGAERVLRFNGSVPAPGAPMLAGVTFADAGTTPSVIAARNGRFSSTRINGIGEQPGFKSLGEIMCARFRQVNSGGALVPASVSWPCNIDAFGFDTNATGQPLNNSFVGIDQAIRPASASTETYNGGTPKWQPNLIGNEHGEKLLLASGALGTLSVRSDTFAVWFVLHGYQRSDCEGLGVNDPLTPSIARRFVMVVDRSNVTKLGDTPKVLLFKEVPLN